MLTLERFSATSLSGWRWSFIYLLLLLASGAKLGAQSIGFDSGMNLSSANLAQLGDVGRISDLQGRWLRIRGVPDPSAAGADGIRQAQGLLQAIHRQGWRVCVLLSGPSAAGLGGSGAPEGAYLPLDLREPRRRLKRLEESYRGLIDAWEIENEPDLGFVPENAESYAAYLKACYLAVKPGDSPAKESNRPRVIMAPLGLPPGPYLERLVANGLLSYTDGFNYHFYGYAADFTGVYRQFEGALSDLNQGGIKPVRPLPIFLTECGYGMLGHQAADTVEGRVRQWDWFREVSTQLEILRPEAPMMFLLRPYLERNLTEFGLEMPVQQRLTFGPADFGEKSPSPWLHQIGLQMGASVASPALAYLASRGVDPALPPRAWTLPVAQPSPIVIDFLPEDRMRAIKGFQGYALSGPSNEALGGKGELRVYNFSDHSLAGHLEMAGPVSVSGAKEIGATFKLKSQELRVMPVELEVSRKPWRAHPWTVTFVPDPPAGANSVFSTILYPEWKNSRRMVVAGFNFRPEQTERERRILRARPLAKEEPALEPEGRWLVTPGLHVRDSLGLIEFEIQDLPSRSLRPASAELCLPDTFVIPENSFLRIDRRCESAGSVLSRYAGLSSAKGGIMQIEIRTANGNLYEVWPRRSLNEGWEPYEESVGNFTMSFFGRANLPWRFHENRPVALVFTFWPRTLPTVVAINPTGFVRME